MVASSTGDLYSPFQPGMANEDGPQSSSDGSGLHSPVFGAHYPPANGDNFRYQQDQLHIQQGVHAAQFEYLPTLVQQPPLIDTALEMPSPTSEDLAFHGGFSSSPRTHLRGDYHVPPARLPPPLSGSVADYRYQGSSERRLPSGTHDSTYHRVSGGIPSVSIDDDHRRPPISPTERVEVSPTTNPTNPVREPRREISTVVIACRQCRGRKIRCDSTRPVCNNCVRRSNVCEYDAVPKRRGPDKRPGTRQRSCKKRPADGSVPPPPKRKRTTAPNRPDVISPIEEVMGGGPLKQSPTVRSAERQQGQPLSISTQTPSPIDIRGPGDQSILTKPEQSPNSRRYYPHDPASYSKPSFPRPLDLNVLHSPAREHQKFPSPASPAAQSDQRMWWDNFLKTYPLPDVADDLTYLFTDAGYWLSFLNVKFFRDTLLNAQERIRIQPAFVLAALAMSTLMKSSETEYAVQGRTRALYLRNLAQSALEAAWESEWIDAALAEAALILALFETSVHPEYNPTRVENALIFLDNIVRRLSLTSIDTNDPEVSFFPQRGVPVVLVPGLDTFSHSPHERKCSCIPTDASHPPDPFNTWSYPLPWDSSWSTNEIRDEECRRVCWSALGLIANYTLQCAAFDRDPPKLFLSSPSNYALLFPGEAVDRTSPPYRSADSQSQKESVWALYCRSMLLWCFCDQLRREPYVEEDKAEYAHEAWNETQSIQDSLDLHVCNLDTAVMYMCREYIYNSRMAITQALRRLVPSSSNVGGPVFTRKQADEWIYYQEQIVKRVTMSIQRMAGTPGHQLTRRPFQVTWFSNQLALCLRLWNNDRSLYGALELAKAIMIPLDMVNSIWPCPQHQHQCDDLRKHLIEACTSVGMGLPSLTNRSLPPLMKTH
ncbi:hypothetical protein ARMGADRAFT_1000409 [Armillaria gallica]|uniref:Zn(2)-C6 fungal-type domain-containing protein n=1 Tax=Armillaria gallica TaxID=47427 RepID=A0A2H3CM92_ARMGA|nr:hypothetical protein ARMGADRAFT_1000409 [Armillaria gallica]